jgi:hypothetical protein
MRHFAACILVQAAFIFRAAAYARGIECGTSSIATRVTLRRLTEMHLIKDREQQAAKDDKVDENQQ